jgi:hypothetical protein
MFGLDKISWTQFSLFLFYATAIWYSSVLALAWIKGQTSNAKSLFEVDDEGTVAAEVLLPVSVLAANFPREMITLVSKEEEDLITVQFEDSSIDDGYPLEQFSDNDLSNSPLNFENIQALK